MSRLEIITGLLAFARSHGAPPDYLRWLVDEQRAATVLLFRYAGRSKCGAARWRVGPPDAPVEFTAKLDDAVRALHHLAKHKSLPVCDITDAASASEAARGTLKRGIAELHKHCPPLADALRIFTIEGDTVHHRQTAPRVVVD